MKLGEVVVHIEYYNFTKFHYILMKKIIVFYQTHLTDGPSVRGRRIGPKCMPTYVSNYMLFMHIAGRNVQMEV